MRSPWLQNKVNIRALDIQVKRHVSTIRIGVEIKRCITWLIDKDKKQLTTMQLTNWFEMARKIQKRDQNKALEKKEAFFTPRKSKPHLEDTSINDSVSHFIDERGAVS